MSDRGRRDSRAKVGLAAFVLGLAAFCAAAPSALFAQASCDPLPRGVVAWWPGDGTADDLTLDAHDGLPLNGVAFGAGPVGNAFVFDGIDDRVDVADAPELRPSRFTLAAWVRVDVALAQSCVICKQFGNGTADSYSLWLAGGVLRGGMFGFAEAIAPSPFPQSSWVHAATTYDGSILRLYQDGRLVATAAGPASPVPYDANAVILGAEDNGVNAYTGFLRGAIDEAQIFGRALSGCEIRALARATPGGSCKGDGELDGIPDFEDGCPAVSDAGQQDADGDGAGDACDCAPADAGAFAIEGDSNDLSFESRQALDWCRDPTFRGTGTVYDVLRGDLAQLPVSSAGSECRSSCIVPLAGLVGWWGGDGAAQDLIGGHGGVLENGAGYRSGWVREAFGFDGVDDRVRTGNLTLGNTFSVAAWVNSDVVNQGAYRRIVETSFATGFFVGTDATGIAYKLSVKSPASPYGTVNGGLVVPGRWQLVVGTYDGATGTLYVDGTAVASGAFAPPGSVTLPVNIGAYFGGGIGWKGRVDEVLIFDRALSALEVQSLHEAGCAGLCKQPVGGVDAEWTDPAAVDRSIPAPGRGFWYVYRGRNACGTGTYGSASNGTERTSAVCD